MQCDRCGVISNCQQYLYLDYCDECSIIEKTKDLEILGECIKCKTQPQSIDNKFCENCNNYIKFQHRRVIICSCGNWYKNKCLYCDKFTRECQLCKTDGYKSVYCDGCI